jgi:hypothetical protein
MLRARQRVYCVVTGKCERFEKSDVVTLCGVVRIKKCEEKKECEECD